MITADEIKKAWEVLKKAKFKINDCTSYYNENGTFSILDASNVMEIHLTKDEMIAIADWVQCLFIDDGE